MRALFFLLDGDTNASSRHRVLQYLPLLREHGIESVVSRPVPPPIYDRLVERGPFDTRAKAAFYSLFAASRLRDVLRARAFDVAVIQRDLFPFGPPLLERLLRGVNPRIVYDTDDATYLRPSFTTVSVFQKFRDFDKVAEVVRHARWVSVATETIATWARQHNPHVSVVPMALSMAPYDAAFAAVCEQPRSDEVVIGWAGTGGGVRYLEALAPVLRTLAERRAVRVRVISGAYCSVRLPGVPVDAIPWQAAGELERMAAFDVGLVPLDNTPFERAKFPFKMLQYLALGVPPVCARVGTAAEVIHDGQNGLLAASPDEWLAQLDRLCADAALRRRLATAGRDTVRAHYTAEHVAPTLAAGLHQAASR